MHYMHDIETGWYGQQRHARSVDAVSVALMRYAVERFLALFKRKAT